jgi:Methyltransferase domain
MFDKALKIPRLISDRNRLDRARILTEIGLNKLFFDRKPQSHKTIEFEKFLDALRQQHWSLVDFLKPGGEAETAIQWARARFAEVANQPLPFPSFYNADTTLALLTYGLVRDIRPRFVLETGVGYGITSALVLRALEQNGFGELVSVDLPSLADPQGSCVGLVVPDYLKSRWSLHIGSSRTQLPRILARSPKIGVFISDSANVYTLQRYEFKRIFPSIVNGGAALFNNISSKFQQFLNLLPDTKCFDIWQIDKPGCVTGLVVKS